jgi:hypothetical protein
MPGKPGQVRRVRRYGAVQVSEPRKHRVIVSIDTYQASARKHGGYRGLPGAGTACDLDGIHQYLSSARSADSRKRVCG